MKWGIFWKPRPDGPWKPWTDKLFVSKSAAVTYWMRDRQEGIDTTDPRWRRWAARSMRRTGIRLCPARIEPEAPRVYLGDVDG